MRKRSNHFSMENRYGGVKNYIRVEFVGNRSPFPWTDCIINNEYTSDNNVKYAHNIFKNFFGK